MRREITDRRTLRTRQLLTDALGELIRTKRYEAITVQEIADRANVGRSTFYAHFTDKDDLVADGVRRMVGSLETDEPNARNTLSPSLGLFHHVQAFSEHYLMMARGRHLTLFLDALQVELTAMFADRLLGRPTRANFRTGGLTVSTLVPMRSVPHRVVVLLGLDDDTFPRVGASDGDDLLARDPLTGERDPRSEDRQLLLDATLAATETLVITYTGANEFSGQDRPPAVPVGELLAVEGFDVRPGQLGENVTTSGVDLLALPTGTRLRLGAQAVVELTGLRNPCTQLDGFADGLMRATLDRGPDGELIRKAGVMAIVLVGGQVRPGDAIGIERPTGPPRPLQPV